MKIFALFALPLALAQVPHNYATADGFEPIEVSSPEAVQMSQVHKATDIYRT
jgi:hypothetical protein